MAVIIGLKTNTHVFVCTESIRSSSILKIKEDENRTTIFPNTIFSIAGKQADEIRYRNLVREILLFNELDRKIKITPSVCAEVISKEIYSNVRKMEASCSSVVGGVFEGRTELFGIDPYGALHSDEFITTGYGIYFLYGIYDAYYSRSMGKEEALKFLRQCINALKKNLVLDTSTWMLSTMDKDGKSTSEIIKIME